MSIRPGCSPESTQHFLVRRFCHRLNIYSSVSCAVINNDFRLLLSGSEIMGDFFHGWRCKAGALMLLIALFLMCGWVRSLGVSDMIGIPTQSTEEVFTSSYQTLSWLSYRFHSDESTIWLLPHGVAVFPEWYANSIRPGGHIIHDDSRIRWRWRYFGFGEGEIKDLSNDGDTNTLRVIPYWSVVFPMMVISAYLLLIVPRSVNETASSAETPI